MLGITGQQIEKDIFEIFTTSYVPSRLRGKVYRHGMRPDGSECEDAVVRFIGGDMDRIDTGLVMIGIYVPGIDVYGDGVKRCDIERCEDIEMIVNEWANSLTSIRPGYRLCLDRIVSTEQEPDSGQHFVALRLRYRLI